MHINCYKYSLRMAIQMNYLVIIEEIIVYGHLIRMAIIPKFTLLLHCQPLHPEKLWENFKVAMWEDYVRYFRLLQGQRKAYMQINTMVYTEGKSLADFPQMEQLIENVEEDDYMTLEEAMEVETRQYKQLNDKQKEIVDLVLNRSDIKLITYNTNHI